MFGSDRFSFAATFGALTYLCFEIAVKRRYVVKFADGGPVNIQILGAVISIIVYTVDYFPLLAALADKTIIGDFIGTLYILMLASMYLLQKLSCYGIEGSRLILFVQNIPIFMCLIFLSVSFPSRLYLSIRKVFSKVEGTNEEFSALECDNIRKTPQGKYVQRLLTARNDEGLKMKKYLTASSSNKLILLIQRIKQKFIYRDIPEFRYSMRIVGVIVVCLLLLFMWTAEVLIVSVPILSHIKSELWSKIAFVEQISIDGNSSEHFTITALHISYEVSVALQVSVIFACCFAFIIGLINIMHTLTSYRQYLMELHRGIYTHIPSRSSQKNTDILVGSMRFAGYQIGFTIVAYPLQAIIGFVFTFGISIVIIIIRYKRADPFLRVVKTLWPMIVFSLLVRSLQLITAKFIFLQQKGAILAMQYRRCYLVFLYFTFILDIIIGSMRCPYRLLKAMILGSLTLSRLDHCALSRTFEHLDTGFSAYVGFLHFENSNSHPVLTTFVRLLLARPGGFAVFDKRKVSTKVSYQKEEGIAELGHAFWKDNKLSKAAQAQHRWQLLYTLIKNPQLQFRRKQNAKWLED